MTGAAADIDAAKKLGRTGLSYAFQDGVAFEADLSRLDTFQRLGVRVIHLTCNRRNLLDDAFRKHFAEVNRVR